MREHEHASAPQRKRRFDDEEPRQINHRRAAPEPSTEDDPDAGDRWSSWDASGVLHGPEPRPDWVITELAAVDTELGVLKTGKEADVHLVERGIPDTERSVILAAKRYRSAEHRMFHRDAGYLEGRRVRRSRETRAMANRTDFGRQVIAGQWAAAEFDALGRLWKIGREYGAIAVPYPVQLLGTELLMEYLDEEDGTAAPRLAQLRPEPDELRELWRQLGEALTMLARVGLAHGDLSAYNLLVHRGRLVVIDLPQVIDIVGNPRGPEFLARDVVNVSNWFAAKGLPAAEADPQPLIGLLLADAGMR